MAVLGRGRVRRRSAACRRGATAAVQPARQDAGARGGARRPSAGSCAVDEVEACPRGPRLRDASWRSQRDAMHAAPRRPCCAAMSSAACAMSVAVTVQPWRARARSRRRPRPRAEVERRSPSVEPARTSSTSDAFGATAPAAATAGVAAPPRTPRRSRPARGRRTRPPGGRARSRARRRRSTRARSGGSCRARAAGESTASVSISTRRPNRWSAGSVSWRIWPKCDERGSDMSIITWVAISGSSSISSSSTYHQVASRNWASSLSGAEALGLLEEAGLGPDPLAAARRRPRGRRAGRPSSISISSLRHHLEQPEVQERDACRRPSAGSCRGAGRRRTGGGGTCSRSRSGRRSRRRGRASPGRAA